MPRNLMKNIPFSLLGQVVPSWEQQSQARPHLMRNRGLELPFSAGTDRWRPAAGLSMDIHERWTSPRMYMETEL